MKRLLVLCFVVLWGLALIFDSDTRLPEIDSAPLPANAGVKGVAGTNPQLLQIPIYFIPDNGQVENNWIVKPGEDPARICFRYENVKTTRLAKNGDLIIETPMGKLIHNRLTGYQVVGGEKVPVKVDFRLIETGVYGFRVGHYNETYELVIVF